MPNIKDHPKVEEVANKLKEFERKLVPMRQLLHYTELVIRKAAMIEGQEDFANGMTEKMKKVEYNFNLLKLAHKVVSETFEELLKEHFNIDYEVVIEKDGNLISFEDFNPIDITSNILNKILERCDTCPKRDVCDEREISEINTNITFH